MTSLLDARLWHLWPLVLDREKSIDHTEVRQQIIRMTIPKNGPCRLLGVGGMNYNRLTEAVSYNHYVQATALLQNSTGLVLPETPSLSGKIECRYEELTLYRTVPEFDVIFLCEWLARIPVDKRKNTLQYCKMLLKPGGSIVTTAAKKASSISLQTKDVTTILQAASFYNIDTRRLTGSHRLVTAQRPISKR